MKSKTVVRGPEFDTLLTLLFITLKLTGVIAWPWIWVLAPLWGTFVLTVILLLLPKSVD